MQIKPLSEISVTISSGLTPLRSNPEFWNNGTIPWLKTEQLGEKYIYSTNEFISKNALEETSIKVFPKDSLSIAMYGEGKTRGNLSIIKEPMTTNQACCNVVIDSKKADYEYVYYFLKTQYNALRSLSSGVRKNLNSNDIKNYPIRLPNTINEQIAISHTLKKLDKKIELNNQINAELEAMAKTLYDYWFVQFDFPDADGKPYKSSGGKMVYNEVLKREIPEQWEAKPLLDITSVSNHSVDPAKNSEILFKLYSIPVFDITNSYSIEKGNSIGSNKFTVEKLDLLVSKLNPWFNRVVYALDLQDQTCSTEFVVWRCPSLSIKNFMYLIATSDQFISHCTQSATGTSNSHKRVNPNVMMGFVQPFDKEIAEQFGETADPMIKTIMANRQENLQLEKLRDWLLPMLMNGQVTVK